MNENKSSKTQLVSAIAVMTFVLLCALWAMTRQLEKPLLDLHAFRQTQTAISAYYMAEDAGMFFNYITPVLGKPWSIPMELPIYQWIVARWHNLSSMGLDQSGKMISMALWFACIWPIWRLLGALGQTTPQRCLSLILVYSCPLYLYWGRAFMIESTGLFLSLCMVASIYTGYTRRSWPWLLIGLNFGIAAALCKVTTWAVSVGVAELLVLFATGWLPQKRDFKWIGITSATLMIQLIPAKLWIAYGDSIKSQNPFASKIIVSTLPDQKNWNYGTLSQKIDVQTWQHIWQHVTDQIIVPVPLIGPLLIPLVLLSAAFASPKRIPILLVFTAGFFSGPLVFTNLYLEHSYYWCANGIWILLASGIALTTIYEYQPLKIWPKLTALFLSITIALCGFKSWFTRSLPILKSVPTKLQLEDAWIRPVQSIVPVDRTLLIVGHEWNSFALYYAQRKGIAYPQCGGIQFPGPELNQSLEKLDKREKLGAIIIAERLLTQDNQKMLTLLLQQLGMSLNGNKTAFGIMFISNDLVSAINDNKNDPITQP